MEESKDFKYILRFAVQPGHHEEERLEELIQFCSDAQIDDVMFFINCEELNQGHLTMQETTPWMELIARVKDKLDKIGVTTSINPWITMLHADRGRRLKDGQNFNTMVDPYGNPSTTIACPLCSDWRKYIAEMYAYYASIKPNMIWVEDDFRFHNHAPLIWGGCFCEKHMEEYSRRAGKKLTREEFLEGILKPGSPHPYRKIWLDTCRDTLVELAEMIGQAVHRVSPDTKIGLMSSYPQVHCAEGRDWEGILRGLAGDNNPVNRPHLPAYSTATLQRYLVNFSAASRMTVAAVPEKTELYPELESFPHTRFSKSKAFTRFQLETSLALSASGITLNIFDMMGNGIMKGEGYQRVLASSKEFLLRVKALDLNRENEKGVKILFNPKSSYTLETSEGKEMRELYPKETFWSSILSSYGISNLYSREKGQKGEITAVSGQYFENMMEGEIRDLFENNFVILEGDAAYTLYSMGYGKYAGIKSTKWYSQDSGRQAFEQVCNGKEYCGIKEARISSQVSAGHYLEIEYDENIYKITEVMSPYLKVVGPGMAVYNGRVLILPYGRFSEGFDSHLNTTRQEIVKDIIKNIKGFENPIFIEDAPYVSLYHYNKEGKDYILLCNCSDDDIDEISLYAPKLNPIEIREISRKGEKTIDFSIEKNDHIVLKSELPSREVKVFNI